MKRVFLFLAIVAGMLSCTEVDEPIYDRLVEYIEPEIVDLGLSVCWGSFNLGAESMYGDGVYFAWGETKTKSTFSNSNYSQELFSYKGILDKNHDAASVKLNSHWRIATTKEWAELITKCSWKKEVDGYRVTSQVPGYTDKSIYLPKVNSSSSDRIGYYWSSGREGDSGSSLAPAMDLNRVDCLSEAYKCMGCLIRPVYVK